MLKGKVAIVTGGTRGIGYEIVRTFLKNNAIVVLFGSKEDSVNKRTDGTVCYVATRWFNYTCISI